MQEGKNMLIIGIITSFMVVGAFAYALVRGAALSRSPEENRRNDEEQIEYLSDIYHSTAR